jgi:sulfide:quinone oxidoreductase
MRVLIAGGGFAGAEALLALRDLAGDRVEIELVSASESLVYRPHAVREPFGLGEIEHIPLEPLCAAHGAKLTVASVLSVDVPGRRVETDRAGSIGYDLLLVALGARRQPAVEGALTFDGTRGVVELRGLIERAAAGLVRRIAFMVPGGVAWPLPAYELALLTEAELRGSSNRPHLHVVTPEPEPLGLFGVPASERVRKALAARGIGLHPPDALRRIGADAVVALPRVVGPRLRGLPSTPDGFVPVDAFGLVDGTSTVYAAGDLANHVIKQGGLAAQQAEVAATHIAARAGAPVKLRPYEPELRALLLTGGVPLHLLGGPQPAATSRPLWPALGKVIGTRLARWLGVDEPADRPQGLELALMLADDEARQGHRGSALEWLTTAEAIAGELPAGYAEKRRAWTLGAGAP